MHDLGSRLRHLRRTANLSQTEVADRVGVSQKTVSIWELGVGSPRVSQCIALAELFEVELAWLATGRGVSPRATGTDG